MMNKSTFSKITKRILRSQKGMRDPKLVHPEREWILGVLVALSILLGAAAWSAVTYVEYQNVELSLGQNTEAEVVVYRESLVNASLEVFTQRQQRLDQLMASLGSPGVEEPAVETERATSSQAEAPEPADETATSTSTSTPETITEEPEPATPDTPTEPATATSSSEAAESEEQPPANPVVNPSPSFEL